MEQLSLTSKMESLADHRELLKSRWNQLQSFAFSQNSPTKLSPDSKKLKRCFFQQDSDDGHADKLAPAVLKSFKKRLTGYMQSVTNASDRLNEVHREECTFACISVSTVSIKS